jgi:hypothetical protein
MKRPCLTTLHLPPPPPNRLPSSPPLGVPSNTSSRFQTFIFTSLHHVLPTAIFSPTRRTTSQPLQFHLQCSVAFLCALLCLRDRSLLVVPPLVLSLLVNLLLVPALQGRATHLDCRLTTQKTSRSTAQSQIAHSCIDWTVHGALGTPRLYRLIASRRRQ